MKRQIAWAASVVLAFVLGSATIGNAARRFVLPADSVGTTQLKTGAVTGAKVRDGSLAARDFHRGQLPVGPQGPTGAPGPPGPAGAAPSAATLGLQFVGGESGFDPSSPKTATVMCPVGKRAISWAFSIQRVTSANEAAAPGVTEITPLDFDVGTGKVPGGYTVKAETFGFYPDAWKLFAYATCATG